MQKLKNFFKFFWEDLYNKRSIMFVNIYNFIATAWLALLYAIALKHPYDFCVTFFFSLFGTFYLGVFVHFVCNIIFFIETKKNKKMKDNPIIKSKLYRVISIFSICIVFLNYSLFLVAVVCYAIGHL